MSKKLTRILGQEGRPREDEGAIGWRMLTPMFHRSEEVDEAGMVGLLGASEQLEIFSVLFVLHSVYAC